MALGLVVTLVLAGVLVGASLVGGTAGRTVAAAATLRPNALSAGDTYTVTIPKFGTIEINSFSFGVSSSVTASGGLTGKRQHSPVTIVREVDATSPKLFLAAADGSALGTVKITVQPPDEEFGDTAVISLSHAIVAADSWSGPSGDDSPTESLSFAYSAIAFKYTSPIATG
jgi:type VI secretion system secreted protein Hcp